MNVVTPNISDKQLIYSLYNTALDDDSQSIDYFFTVHYDPSNFYIAKKGDLVICSMEMYDYDLYLKGYQIEVKLIHKIVFSNDCSEKLKSEFIEACLKKLSYQKVLTLSSLKLIQQYNFERIFMRKRYKLTRPELFNVDGYSISDHFETYELQEAYDSFVRHFDSYLYKDLEYFNKQLEFYRHHNYEVYVSRNSNHDIVGYIVYNYIEGELEVVSIVYKDTLALLTLLNQAMGMNSHIYVTVSLSENFERVFGVMEYEVLDDAFVRINDEELFKRLFNTEHNSLKEFLSLNVRPLYLGL